MADASRGKRVLATLLVLLVLGLAAVLVGLQWKRGRRPAPPPAPGGGGDVVPTPTTPKEEARSVEERLRRLRADARAAVEGEDPDYAAAVELLEEAHKLALADADIADELVEARKERDFLILFDQGEAALAAEQYALAVTYYQKAIEIHPKAETIEARIRFCRYTVALREAQEAGKKEDWKAVEAKAGEALAQNPEGQLAKDLLALARGKLGAPPAGLHGPPAGLHGPPEQPGPEGGPSGEEMQAKVRSLQDGINRLKNENFVESFAEAVKLCDELAVLLAKFPDSAAKADSIAKVTEQRKLIGEKQAGYEKLYVEKLKQAQAALAGDPEHGRPQEPGRAIAMAEQFRGKYRKDTSEIDAFIQECRRRSVVSDMVLVKSGMYDLGGDEPSDSPRRQVITRDVFIDKHEVTNQQYKAFVDATGHRWPRLWSEGGFPAGLEHYPVMGVSFSDAEAFGLWAGRRLPTEDEWEVAASDGTGGRFPWGDEWVSGRANTLEKGSTGPVQVGSHPEGKSALGLLDVIGNVAEWTSSTTSDADDPKKTLHIAKGGNFFLAAARCAIPSRQAEDGSIPLVGFGFRCAADATPDAIEQYEKDHSSAPGPDGTSSK